MNMKFLSSNLISGTEELAVSSGGDWISHLLDRKSSTAWESSGSSEGVAATITWTPTIPTTISRILLLGCNFKTFTIKYDSTSEFSPVISESANADENKFYEVAAQSVESIIISCTNTIGAVAKKLLGGLIICTEHFECTHQPEVPYESIIDDPAGAVYTMLDGGTRRAYVADKFECDLFWSKVSDAEYANFKALYDLKSSFIFVPFPDTSSWNGQAYDVVIAEGWKGDKYTNAYMGLGRDIELNLKES